MIKLPNNVKYIIRRFEENGYEAYAVGGCVRDSLLNREPKDWDIATNATPNEMRTVFTHLVPTGEKYGTMTLVLKDENNNQNMYEITAYRQDSSYSDGRRPDNVSFSKTLHDDMSRRDFTVNAMAYNERDGLIDMFSGAEDLRNGVIRCVGNPEERFCEDALRTMRAVRFAMRYNFAIEDKTLLAVRKYLPRLDVIARERIRAELCEMLLALSLENRRYFDIIVRQVLPLLWECRKCIQNNPHHIYDVYEHTIHAVAETPPVLHLRLAMLLHDIGKPACKSTDENGVDHFYKHPLKSKEIAHGILNELRFDNETKQKTLILIEHHDRDNHSVPPSRRVVARILRDLGEELTEDLFKIKTADCLAQNPEYVQPKLDALAEARDLAAKIKADSECFSIKDLALDGRDLIELGYSGAEIGRLLNACMEFVLDNPDKNTKDDLVEFIRKNAAENGSKQL